MNLRQEIKDSGRYEYTEDKYGFTACSHKYKSSIIFRDDGDMLQYVIYNDGNPEGTYVFGSSTDITLEKLEKIIDIVEAKPKQMDKEDAYLEIIRIQAEHQIKINKIYDKIHGFK